MNDIYRYPLTDDTVQPDDAFVVIRPYYDDIQIVVH